MGVERDAKRRRGTTSRRACNPISEGTRRLGRARTWSIGSRDSSSGYESNSNFYEEDLVRVRRVFMAMRKEDAYQALPLVNYLRHAQIIATSDVVEALAENGVPSIELSSWIGSGTPGDESLLLHPKLLESITAPGRSWSQNHVAARGNSPSSSNHSDQELPSPRPRSHSLIELVLLSFPPLHDGVLEGIGLEQIDLLRASAKSFRRCAVCSHLSLHSQLLIEDLTRTNGCTGLPLRRRLASQAFEFSATHARAAAASFASTLGILPPVVDHARECEMDFEYGQNLNLLNACLLRENGKKSPFQVLSGTPGYNTMFEALTGWGLAMEIKTVLKSGCCVFLKAGIVVGVSLDVVPLTETEAKIYGVSGQTLSSTALSVVRAKNTDPVACHGGAYVVISEEVDEEVANILVKGGCTGVSAPCFTEKAEGILSSKRVGNFITIQQFQLGPETSTSSIQFREDYGMVLGVPKKTSASQNILPKMMDVNGVYCGKDVVRDMSLAKIILQHIPSAAAVICLNGATVAVAPAQCIAADALEIAYQHLSNWWCRQHPRSLELFSLLEDLWSSNEKIDDIVNSIHRFATGKLHCTNSDEMISGALKISPDNSYSGTFPKPLMHDERVKQMSKLVPEASNVVCAACAAGDWGVDRDEELIEVQTSCRIAQRLGVSHFGIQDVSNKALKTAVEMFRECGTLIVPLGEGMSFIP